MLEEIDIRFAFDLGEEVQIFRPGGYFSLLLKEDPRVFVEIKSMDFKSTGRRDFSMFLLSEIGGRPRTLLSIWGDGDEDSNWNFRNPEAVEEFLPLLRRAAYRLGIPIEFSAHEMAIWGEKCPSKR